MNDWNKQVIEEFRANDGKVAQFGDAPLVILQTIGAKTGKLREIPLVTLVQDEGMYIFASKAGSTSHPDWYHNLKANPEISVEYKSETFTAQVEELPAELSAQKLSEQADLMPQFAEYIENAKPRVIPAFSISRVD